MRTEPTPTPQAKPSLDELFAELDAAPLDRDALFAVFDRMKFFYPDATDEIRPRVQARLDLARDEAAGRSMRRSSPRPRPSYCSAGQRSSQGAT